MVLGAPDEKRIEMVANSLAAGAPIEHIRADMIDLGYSEYSVFLAVKAAEILNVTRENLPPARPSKVRRV